MHQDGPELARDRLKLLPKTANMAQRSLGTGALKNQAPVPEQLLVIGRPSERHRMHQDGPELAQDRLKLLPKAAK